MVARQLRKITVAVSVLAVLAGGSGPASACCFWKSATTAYYAPAPVVAPPCTTCNYVPQVAYRTVYTSVPVTTYRPITALNPCGCPVTAMQPVTAYRLQPQLVPYTTYRPVMTSCCAAPMTVGYAPAPACATGACGAAVPAATTYYAPAVAAPAMVAPALPAAPAAPCCGNASSSMAPMAAASYAVTPAPNYSAIPSYSSAGSTTFTPSPSTPSTGPATSQPTLPAAGSSGSGSSSPPSTFQQNSSPSDSTNPAPSYKPIPDLETSSAPQRSNMVIPRKVDNAGDLTASNSLPGSGVIRQASTKVVIPASTTTVDNGQWRAPR